MATTIQVSSELKNELQALKENKTYEEFIKELLIQTKRLKVAQSMEEYGKKEGKTEQQELNEWEHTEITW